MDAVLPLLMNARAGALHDEKGPPAILRMARDVELDLQIIQCLTPNEMTEQLKRIVAEGAERVAVAGGDGTVGLAVQQLAHTQTALGILSMGTFNNFATALRLHHNLPAAIETLKKGVVREVDLGRVGSHYFTESGGAGLFADALALYGAGSNKNVIHGLYAFLRLLLSFQAREMEIVVDGEMRAERVTLLEVANTYRVAQAAPIAPEADLADGVLDIVAVCDLRRKELLLYLRALRAQLHTDLPKVKVFRGREIVIRSSQRRNVHADDRIVGVTPQKISIQPKALKVLVDDHL